MSSVMILFGFGVGITVLDSMGSVLGRFGVVVDGLKNASSVLFAIFE